VPLRQSDDVTGSLPGAKRSGPLKTIPKDVLHGSDAMMDDVEKKGEEQEEEKKELVFIGGIPLIDLDDYEVNDRTL
jgi:hypothetical protein